MAEDKILKEEILDDAELDNVAGGTREEVEDDRKRLMSMGVYNFDKTKGFTGSVADSFAKLGQDLGIDLKVTMNGNISETTPNKYFIKGVEVSRNVAWEFINDVYSRNKK